MSIKKMKATTMSTGRLGKGKNVNQIKGERRVELKRIIEEVIIIK